MIVAGIASFGLVWLVHPVEWNLQFWSFNNIVISSIGIGLASILLTLLTTKKGEESQQTRQKLIDFYVFANILQFSAYTLLDLTTLLHPITFDAVAYHIDATSGFNPSAAIAKLYAAVPRLATILDADYEFIAFGFPLIYALQLRCKQMPPANMLLVWVVSTLSCLIAYHLCPITGPIYLFGKDFFPNALPELSKVIDFGTIVTPVYRNGLPSMHFGTCLMLVFTARYQRSKILNLLLYVATALTFMATLGKGEHYLIDLVVSFPFIVAIQSYCTHVTDQGQKYRLFAIIAGISLWLGWVVLVRYGLILFQVIPGLIYLVSLITILGSLFVYQRIWPYEVWGYCTPLAQRMTGKGVSPRKYVIPALFFVSGFTGLMYEVVFSKQLSLTFGSMSTATYTILIVYMSGMAIGAWLGGLVVNRSSKSGLILYASCELVIGLYCLATPVFFRYVQVAYVAMAQAIPPDSPVLIILRMGAGGLVLLIPTILMGMTLPVMVTELQRKGWTAGGAVSNLYGANTLGAATGALLSGYILLPTLGVSSSIALSAVGSMAVALTAMQLNKSAHFKTGEVTTTHADDLSQVTSQPAEHRAVWSAMLTLFLTGCVTLLIEVNYMQLLAVVAGNSVYAFSLMLFSLLLGLGAGSIAARHLLDIKISITLVLSVLLSCLSGILLIGNFQWNSLPAMFAAYGVYPYHLNFIERETIRAIACWFMMFPPALIIGACYPLAIELVAHKNQKKNQVPLLGSAIGINTVGNIVGTLAGGFILLPMIGTQKSIWVAATICLIASLMAALSVKRLKNGLVLGCTMVVLILFAGQPSTFDYTKLSSGSNVYFQFQNNGHVIAHTESVDGGLTSVAIKQNSVNVQVKTLLTNGKFQGNNDIQGEMRAQLGFAIAPLLHTSYRDSALVIGYGTGVSARAIKESGFNQLDIVDLSKDLIQLANTHFSNVNARVSEQAGVHTYITDGRNFLLLQNKKYDLISMEITSIWFAGAASLYNQEFYELVSKRLTDNGVLQQWVQLHHMTPVDIACILSTVRSVFPNVRLYIIGGQGIIIATKNEQHLPSEVALKLMTDHAGLLTLLQQADLKPAEISRTLMLTPDDVNHLVKSFESSSDFMISNDDNLYLEYSTPKANALDGPESLKQMLGFLRQFSSTSAQFINR